MSLSEDIRSIETEIHRRLLALPSSSTPCVRALRREVSKLISKSSAQMVHKLALRLLQQRVAPRFFAYELVQHHREASNSLNSGKLKRLGAGISSWGDVDTFACYLSGPAWRSGQVSDELIISWARSKDRWWRRAAVVSTVPLNNKARGGHGDAQRTLKICRLVIHDGDDMVVKSLSWALRELSKRDAGAVTIFLKENKQHLSSRVLREVTNKLKTGLKNPKST